MLTQRLRKILTFTERTVDRAPLGFSGRMSPSLYRSRRPIALAFALSVVPATAVAARAMWRTDSGAVRLSLFDDAMISMSYARTFADGHGLVWFPGAPRVEGFTNLAWTMVMALMHRIGLGGSAIAAMIMLAGLLCVWATALVGLRLGRTFGGFDDERRAFFTVAIVAANFPLLFWAVRGMEVGLVTLLALGVCALTLGLHDRPSRTASWALAGAAFLGVATRTDFVVVFAGIAGWMLVAPSARRARIVAPILLGGAASLAATTAFRLWYYDRPFPNTYYLKLAGGDVLDRVTRGVVVDLVIAAAYVVPPLLLIALGWSTLHESERRAAKLLLIVAAAHLAYATYAGGDAWETFLIPNRYLTPAVVLLDLLAVLVVFTSTSGRVGTVTGTQPPLAARGPTVLLVMGVGPLITIGANTAVPEMVSPQHRGWFVVPATAVLLLALGCVLRARTTTAPRRSVAVPAAMLATVLLATTAFRLPQVLQDEGNYFSRLGDQLVELTDPEAVIAVTGAGGTQYWSQRPAVDLLGKNDRRIAEGPPRADAFMPGHDKWDLRHSVGTLRPDVVVHAGIHGGLDVAYLDAQGYVAVTAPGVELAEAIRWQGQQVLFARADSSALRWDRLERVGA